MAIIQGGDNAFRALKGTYRINTNINNDNFVSNLAPSIRDSYIQESTLVDKTMLDLREVESYTAKLAEDGIYTTPNSIYTINTLEDLYSTNHAMQRWLTCYPEVKRKILRGKEIFTNHEPINKEIGEDDYDYRRVYGDVLNSNNVKWHIEPIHNPYLDNLSLDNKSIIINAHRFLEELDKEGIDIFNDKDIDIEYF